MIIGLVGLTAFALIYDSENTENINIAKEYTPEEIWNMEFQKKKERRKEGYSKTDKPEMFTEYYRAITTEIGKTKSGYEMNYKIEELDQAKKKYAGLKKTKATIPWIERGPANVGGRTRVIIVDPDDVTHNTWFAAAATGGIWKTTNGGATWSSLSDQFTNLSVNAMAMADSDHDILYAGTGESFPGGTGLYGNGVWKSIDRGLNWSQLSTTATDENFAYVNRVIIDPFDANIVLVATETGIFKTSNGGTSWFKVYSSNRGVEDLVADPTDFNVLFAGENSVGVLRSTDAGDNWTPSIAGIGSGRRFEVAVSPVDHNNVFTSVNVSGEVSNVYISEDNGLNWRKFNDTHAFLSAQGEYDNIIEAHPYNADEVFVGGVDVWKLAFNGTTEESADTVKNAYTVNTSFLSFVNFGGAYLGGGMSTEDGTDRLPSDWVSVEIRFGTGLSQKAHRFNVPDEFTSGVAPNNYTYVDYVDVPFQVWDITYNRQLMVSFRDQEKDGAYNLYESTGSEYGTQGREYIFVNAIEYNPTTPDANITVNGGHLYKCLYFFWPTLTAGETWSPSSLPSSKIIVDYGKFQLYNGVKTSIADSYGTFSGPNGYNQGAGFGNTSIPGLHPDHHNIAIIPTGSGNFTYIDANDGGLGISIDNAATFTMLPNNYRTTQFYGVAKHPTKNEYFGGMQDNGSWQSPADEDASSTSYYFFRIGGDGFECLWHAEKPNLMLGSVYNNDIRKSTTTGATWGPSSIGITEDDGPFITRLSVSKENPDMVFAVGNTGVYKSINFGSNWTRRPISGKWAIDNIVSSSHNVEVSLANGNIVWAGGGMATDAGLQMYVSTNEGASFTAVSDYSVVSMNAYTSGIATHPSEDSTAYVLFSLKGKPKVLRTKDLGGSWEDISGFGTNNTSSNGFPDVVVQSLIVMPHDPNIIWVGTDIGLFESTDNGASWNLANNGLPPVSVYDMQIVGHQVVVATHGRGIWSVDIPEIDNAPYILDFTQVEAFNLNINTNFKVAYDSVQIYIDGIRNQTLNSPEAGSTDIPIAVSEQGTYWAYLIAYIGDQPYKSNTIDLTFAYTPTSIDKVNSLNKIFGVYPNPSSGEFTLKMNSSNKNSKDVYLQLYSLNGLLVYFNKYTNESIIPVNVGILPSGTYLLKVQTEGLLETRKIVIR